ncbi:YdcF family protein [Elioraea sp.]|uniref:YdcF family protein n=1 Tax=Elioraea sp. TaxID=2185103 RepID=UPI0025BECB96|nr:YdcF family protein [Elioraea sp.]
MAVQSIATTLLLPPLLLVLGVLAASLLALVVSRRLARGLAAVTALAATGVLLLATPYVSGHLRASLQGGIPPAPAGVEPRAIIILSAEAAWRVDGADVGPLTLERLRAGAALARRTGLPVLVTGGVPGWGAPPLADLMAASLRDEFGIPVRWVEARSRDTRENAVFSARVLAADGITAGHVVTHAWHLPRTLDAFARAGFMALPAPVRLERTPDGRATDWVPRTDHLNQSWLMLREWAGRLVYAVRDGRAPATPTGMNSPAGPVRP